MDLIYYIPNWLASTVFIIGFFSSAIILIWIFNVITHYFKYKSYPLHPIEYRYINLLEENKQLKQTINMENVSFAYLDAKSKSIVGFFIAAAISALAAK